jgi:phosphatidylethanolamine-binding protein (PEBP) family uncharacterized protein
VGGHQPAAQHAPFGREHDQRPDSHVTGRGFSAQLSDQWLYRAPARRNIQAHHYLFELYTLDKMLDVPRDVTLDQLKAAIKGHQTGQRGVLVAKCCTDSK